MTERAGLPEQAAGAGAPRTLVATDKLTKYFP
jgi:hypothetical protein